MLLGPWSEPTPSVTVPADVATYVQGTGQDARRADVVSFQVVRWDLAKGQTVVKTDDAAPGHLIGEYGSVQYPSSEGTGPESKSIDFNSRSFLLDVTGGRARTPDIGGDRVQYQVPIVAMVAQPDGSVVVRSQWRDKADEVRKDMDDNYRQALQDSGSYGLLNRTYRITRPLPDITGGIQILATGEIYCDTSVTPWSCGA